MNINSNQIESELKTLEEVCEKYKLSAQDRETIGENINSIMMYGKTSVENPIAIIDIAPPGSGKTALNGMGLKQFKNENVIIINSDELKPFHPKINEIAKLYPQYYTKVTNQVSNPWTDNLFETAVKNKYNIIFEGTGRNLKLLKRMIEQMSNYKIIVRGMAVNELNCLMSIIERYEGQLSQKGWGRLVTVEHFYKAYEEMLDTIEQIEKLGLTENIEVYTRGEEITKPKRIYSSKNKEFANAKMAVIIGREIDRASANKYFEEKFDKKILKETTHLEETEILEKINKLYKNKEKDLDEIEI